MIFQRILLGIPRIFAKFIFDWSYFFTGYSRVHCKYQIHRLFAGFGKKNPNNRENHGLIFYRVQQGSPQYTEYIEYSLDSARNTQIIGEIIKRSSEMSKIAIPAKEISENSEKFAVILHALIEQIN